MRWTTVSPPLRLFFCLMQIQMLHHCHKWKQGGCCVLSEVLKNPCEARTSSHSDILAPIWQLPHVQHIMADELYMFLRYLQSLCFLFGWNSVIFQYHAVNSIHIFRDTDHSWPPWTVFISVLKCPVLNRATQFLTVRQEGLFLPYVTDTSS